MKKIQLNLGCGAALRKDFINVDAYKLPTEQMKRDYKFVEADVKNLPFPNDYADYALMDQVLEHIPMKDIPQVLHELRRVLKPGGRAIIMVPDFPSAARQFISVDHNNGFEPFVFHYLAEVIYGNQKHEGEFHKTPMTGGFLHYALNMVGLPNHEIVLHTENSPIPNYPGMESPEDTRLRNAQLVVDIKK